jgi:hypothetical protein
MQIGLTPTVGPNQGGMMKRTVFAILGILLIATGALIAQDKSKMILKAGDEVFACNCGESCPCMTLSRKEGTCSCGNALAKAKVKSVGEGTAVLVFGEREQTFKTVGKFMCACGPSCKCDTISQSPGKCSCGVDMVEVKK